MKVLDFTKVRDQEKAETDEERAKVRKAFFNGVMAENKIDMPFMVVGLDKDGVPVVHVMTHHPRDMALLKHVIDDTYQMVMHHALSPEFHTGKT